MIVAVVGGFLVLLGVLGFILVISGMGPVVPLLIFLTMIYSWMYYAFVHYRQTRQEEILNLLRTAAESDAPMAPALWAYLRDRPQGALREFWVGLLLFFVFPGYYWIWHQKHSFDRKVAQVAYHLEMGYSLSDALRAAPGVVSREVVFATEIGEHTGQLASCLRSSLPQSLVPLWLEILPRLLYPLFLWFALSGIVLFWMNFLLPKMEKIFQEFDMDFPEATQRLFVFGEYVREAPEIRGLVILGLLGFAALLFVSSTVRWYLPGWAGLYRRYAQGHVLKMLAVLLKSEMPLPAALAVLANSEYFAPAVRLRLCTVCRRVEEGETLADSLRQGSLLPAAMVPLVHAAERAHNLPWALVELGDMLTNRTVRAMRRLSQVLSSLFVVALGALVGFIVIGIFMPLIEIITRLAE